MPAPRKPYDPALVVGYIRVSTEEQGDSGAGLDAQRESITNEVAHRRWTLVGIHSDVASGKSADKRPGLARALADVEARRAGTIMVAKLDRLSRSIPDFANLLDRARREGWNVVTIDLGIDLSTPAGEMVAGVMAVVAQWERRIIGQRTSEALRAMQAAGVRLGRPRGISDEVLERIVAERLAGETFERIGFGLMRDRVPTATRRGRTWHASTIRAIWLSQDAEQVLKDQMQRLS